jgi:hypothetical protein
MLWLGIVVLEELLDRRVRSRSDLAMGMGPDVPLLGVLNAWDPAGNRLLGWSNGAQLSLPNRI